MQSAATPATWNVQKRDIEEAILLHLGRSFARQRSCQSATADAEDRLKTFGRPVYAMPTQAIMIN